MRAPRTGHIVAAALIPLALAGCSSIGNPLQALSQKKPGPDEFAVVVRDRLQMPPGLGNSTLPPPDPGRPSPLDPDPRADAATVLTGGAVPPSAPQRVTVSRGEAALLAAADASAVSPAVRLEIQAENEALEANQPYEVPTIFELFSGDDAIDPEVLLDPVAESQRLQATGVPAPVDRRALQIEALVAAEEAEQAAEEAAAAAAPPPRTPRFEGDIPRDAINADAATGIPIGSVGFLD
ncbi:hypothetical protein LNKW23_14340 [Paralimibaculum aggregatum]|uniref:DUF3035 domain-containing protein n=1 Tax=Paralimibaculum aggregatum TaxID=3036245 RepID=A0ABQ6LP71_9RHOB|nr:DUF3035 domain-containing protein [Limibaculum sp. NKW23]GMG82221.1 hypothetical protein LNKW23_14340 [Limibaculum sp. NKW23]